MLRVLIIVNQELPPLVGAVLDRVLEEDPLQELAGTGHPLEGNAKQGHPPQEVARLEVRQDKTGSI